MSPEPRSAKAGEIASPQLPRFKAALSVNAPSSRYSFKRVLPAVPTISVSVLLALLPSGDAVCA